jgi:hypothetical protein
LLRAVMTYSCRSTSSRLERVMRAMMASGTVARSGWQHQMPEGVPEGLPMAREQARGGKNR